MSVVEAVDEKDCPRCGELLPASSYAKSNATGDGLAKRCKPCSRPKPITDGEVPEVMSFRSFSIPLPEDVRARIREGGNYRVTLALHVEAAERRPNGDNHWPSRWPEVIEIANAERLASSQVDPPLDLLKVTREGGRPALG